MRATRPTPAFLALCSVFLAACSGRLPGRLVSTTGQDTGDCLTSACKTITYAVSKASPGDTISVGPGTYHEAVVVPKRLALIGRQATIDAAGQTSPANGVLISGDSAAGTRVAGFTIRNAGLEGISLLHTSDVTIEQDSLFDNDTYGPDNPLCSKHQSDCGEAIHLQAVVGSTIRGNVILHNFGGILLTDEDGPTHDNSITGNTVIDNPRDCGITLASHWYDTTSGKPAAPEVAGVYRNTVARNTVNNNGGVGIGIFASGPGAAAWGNIIVGNTTRKNRMSGLAIHAHTAAQNVDGNELRDNVVADNGTDVENMADRAPAGISVFSMVVSIRNTVISGNRIAGEHYGIITMRLDPIPDLGTANSVDHGVAEATSIH
jgi:parallel beta-helix repeat protein